MKHLESKARFVALSALGCIVLCVAMSALAQSYSIDWHTTDGGGGASTGGVYAVTGTIGQPDAGGAMTGGNYSLTGGFWSLISVVLPPAPVFASCTTAGSGQFQIQASGRAGLTYTLQTSTNLVDWVNDTTVVAGPDGLIEYLEDMESDTPACFYRLVWP